MRRIGLIRFDRQPWPSVERNRQFYLKALSARYELLYPARTAAGLGGFDPPPDAILDFISGESLLQEQQHPDCPLIFGLHGTGIIHNVQLYRYLGRLESSDVIVANCQSDLSLLDRVFGGEAPRFCYMPLPVNSEVFRPLDTAECRRRLNLAPADFVVGFVGRLLPHKNLHQFLHLLASLKQRLYPQTVAGIIVGEYWQNFPILDYAAREYPHFIRKLLLKLGVANNITYIPRAANDEELATIYGAMDLLIHPTNSLDENFGYAPVEAMACGTPVIGAAYGGLKDTIISGQTGFLMPTWITAGGIRMDLSQGLEQAITILTDRQLRARMSTAAARRVRDNYSFSRCAEILCSAIEEAIEKRKRKFSHRVELAPPPPIPAGAGLLPPIEKPWERYVNGVSHYVSSARPEPRPDSRLRLAAPLIKAGDNLYRLDDPAWPATYRLSPAEYELLHRCEDEITVAELELTAHASREQVVEFIKVGLLLGEQPPDWRNPDGTKAIVASVTDYLDDLYNE